MNILVTGAAGFIGSHVCERFLELNNEVIGIDNFDDFYSIEIKRSNLNDLLKDPRFKFYEADIRNELELNNIFSLKHIDIVIHLAAKPGVLHSVNLIRDYFEVNVNGTISLLQSMRRYNIRTMVFGSSSSLYGNNNIPFSENDIEQYPVSPYGITKKSAELICQFYCQFHSFDITCLRFFSVYGPRQRPDLVIHKFTKLIDENQPIPYYGNGKTSRDYTYISDIIDGIICATKHLMGFNIYNLGSSCSIDLETVVQGLETGLCKKANRIYLPNPPGEISITYADISRAKSEIGYLPKYNFSQGIVEFISWYHTKYH
jgi:UDP-glucuronate 4-epimerase